LGVRDRKWWGPHTFGLGGEIGKMDGHMNRDIGKRIENLATGLLPIEKGNKRPQRK